MAADKPNLVVLLSDDHSQVDCSLYGDPSIPVPNMEKLAADGIKMTRCFVASPSCAPSRAAMLTGLMPARNGAEGNHTFPKPGTHSLIDDLKKAGYETAAFGKVAHYGHNPDFGFDHVGPERAPDLAAAVDRYLEGRSSGKPVCVFVGSHDPHVPWPAKTTFDPAVLKLPPHWIDTPATRRQRADYAQAIRHLDNLIGRMRKVASERLGDNTLFLHSSDHGAQWPFGKWNLYDYGTRVPLVAAWPGEIAAGGSSDAMVSWVDLIPTLLEAGGGSAPEKIDGKSFLPVLLGKTQTHRDKIFTTHSGDKNMNVYPIRALRTGEWKLIHNLRPELAFTTHSDVLRGPKSFWDQWDEAARSDPKAKALVQRYHVRPEFELYQVSKDPWELENKIADPEQASRIAEMKKELDEWMKSQGDTGRIFGKPRRADQPETWREVPKKGAAKEEDEE